MLKSILTVSNNDNQFVWQIASKSNNL